MKRQTLSPLRRLAIFEAANGICYLCCNKISAGEKWEIDHIRALALHGVDATENMAPAHKDCHAPKTKADVADIARAKRRKAKHIGIKKRSQWQSKWRKKMNGEVVLR